jgi:hypothetical protein
MIDAKSNNLSLASAAHLFAQGHIRRRLHDNIVAKVRAKKPPVMPAFGSLVPQSAGHYMSTPTPTAPDEGGGTPSGSGGM